MRTHVAQARTRADLTVAHDDHRLDHLHAHRQQARPGVKYDCRKLDLASEMTATTTTRRQQ